MLLTSTVYTVSPSLNFLISTSYCVCYVVYSSLQVLRDKLLSEQLAETTGKRGKVKTPLSTHSAVLYCIQSMIMITITVCREGEGQEDTKDTVVSCWW